MSNYPHETHCNASRRVKIGGEACSCRAGVEIKDLRRQLVCFQSALKALVDQMEVCHADPAYQAVWTMSHMRFGPYAGSKYETQFNAAKALLTLSDELGAEK